MYEDDDDDVECLDDPITLIYEEKDRFGTDTDAIIDLATSSDEETEKPELIPTSNYGKSTLVLPVKFFDVYRNVSLLKKCRPLSVKVVDCGKYPDFGKGKKSDELIRKELNSSTADCDNITPKNTGLSLTQDKDDRTNKIMIGSKGPVGDKLRSEIKQNGNDHVAQDIEMTVEPKDLSQVDYKRNKGLVGLTITTKFPPTKIATEAVGDTQTVYSDERAEKDLVFNSFMKDIGDTLNSLGTIVIPVLEENKNDKVENDTKNDKLNKSSEVSRVNNTSPRQEPDKSDDTRDELKLNVNSPTRCSLKITCSKILEKAIKLQDIVGVNKKPRKSEKDVLGINKKEDAVKLNLKRKTPDSSDFFIVDDKKRSHDRIKKHKKNHKKVKLDKNKTKKHAQSEPAPLNTSCTNLNIVANDAELNQNSPIPIPDYNQHQVVEALSTSNPKKYQKIIKLSKVIPGKNRKSKNISMREAESISELIISQVKSLSDCNVMNNSTNVLDSNVWQLPQNNSVLLTFPKCTKKSTTTTDKTTVSSESKKTDENKTSPTANLNNTQSAPATVLNCNQNQNAVNQFSEHGRMDMNQISLNDSGAPNNAMSNVAVLNRHYANIPGNKIIKLRGSTPPLHFVTRNPKSPGFPIETIVNNRPIQEKQLKFIAPWPYPPPNTNIATYIPNYRMLNPNVKTPDYNNTYPVYWRPPLRNNPPPPYTPTGYNVSNNNPSVKSNAPESSIIGSNADGQLIKKITITATPASEITVKNKEKTLTTLNGANNTSKKSLNTFMEKQMKRTEALSKATEKETVSGSTIKKPEDKVVKPKVVQPSKGYSPPILPIPAYQTVLDILSKSDKSDNNSKQISKKDKMLAKNSKLDHRYDAEVLKRKLMSIESGKYDNAKKISIEEYKKRITGDGGNISNDLKTKCDDMRKMTESLVVDNNLDLGYDSDATVIL